MEDLPGSGKSTLLKSLNKNILKKYKIIDLDNLGHKILNKFNNSDKLKKEFELTYQNKIKDINTKNKNVIYVGMHFPDPRMILNNKEVFIKPFELELHADLKLCLNPGLDIIVKQFLIRHIKNTDNILTEKSINIKNIIEDTKYWLFEYKKRNYKMLTSDKIIKLL